MDKLASLDPIGSFTALKSKYEQLVRASAVAAPGIVPSYKITESSGAYNVSYQSDPYSSQFALAEFCIKNGISASFTFISGTTATAGSLTGFPNNPTSAENDEHSLTDRFISAGGHNWKYRAFMACVQELKTSLGSLWNQCVVQHGAEYARSANKNSGGSDHAINACSTTLLSGALDGFIAIGNIQKTAISDPTHQNYGTYGVGAPVNIEGSGDAQLSFELVANSVLDLLGLQSPFRDKISLFKKLGGRYVTRCENPRNIG
jgi:hypothetical protein